MKVDELDLDRLLEIAFKTPDRPAWQPTTSPEDEVDQFIASFGLRPGTAAIPARKLFEAYSSWAVVPIPRKSFSRYFNMKFKYLRTSLGRFYRLDPVPLGLDSSYSIWKDTGREKEDGQEKG
jgi:hypothetical protein